MFTNDYRRATNATQALRRRKADLEAQLLKLNVALHDDDSDVLRQKKAKVESELLHVKTQLHGADDRVARLSL